MCQAGVPPSGATVAHLVAALRQQLSEEEVAELVAGLAEQAEGVGRPGQAIKVRCWTAAAAPAAAPADAIVVLAMA